MANQKEQGLVLRNDNSGNTILLRIYPNTMPNPQNFMRKVLEYQLDTNRRIIIKRNQSDDATRSITLTILPGELKGKMHFPDEQREVWLSIMASEMAVAREVVIQDLYSPLASK